MLEPGKITAIGGRRLSTDRQAGELTGIAWEEAML